MPNNPRSKPQFRESGDTGDGNGDGGTAPPVEPREKIPGGGALVNPRPAGDSSHRGGTPPDDSAPASGGDLDTLAKAGEEASSSEGGGTHNEPGPDEASSSQGGGDGDDPGSGGRASPSYETIRRRRRSKGLTLRLVDRMEEAVPESPVAYDSARSCCPTIKQEDGYLHSTYCKQRWCVVCQRIRMGKAVNDYGPILRQWDDVHFVSLTVPNVGGDELSDKVGDMIYQLSLCRRQLRETRGLDLKTLRCIECTYNPDRGDFHPHFHVAVNGEEQAEALLEEWLKRHPDAARDAQDAREWDGTDGGLLELVKYATKLFTPKGGDRPDGDVQQEPMDPVALDTIFRALKGRHLLRGTGFDKDEARERAVTEEEIEQEKEVEDFDEEELEARVTAYIRPSEDCIWEWDGDDWYNPDTGEALVGCGPPDAGGDSESNT